MKLLIISTILTVVDSLSLLDGIKRSPLDYSREEPLMRSFNFVAITNKPLDKQSIFGVI